MKNRLLTWILALGMIASLYGAAKGLIALHLGVFSQDLSAIFMASLGQAQPTTLQSQFLDVVVQLARLANELAFSEMLSSLASFALFAAALAISRK